MLPRLPIFKRKYIHTLIGLYDVLVCTNFACGATLNLENMLNVSVISENPKNEVNNLYFFGEKFQGDQFVTPSLGLFLANNSASLMVVMDSFPDMSYSPKNTSGKLENRYLFSRGRTA